MGRNHDCVQSALAYLYPNVWISWGPAETSLKQICTTYSVTHIIQRLAICNWPHDSIYNWIKAIFPHKSRCTWLPQQLSEGSLSLRRNKHFTCTNTGIPRRVRCPKAWNTGFLPVLGKVINHFFCHTAQLRVTDFECIQQLQTL